MRTFRLTTPLAAAALAAIATAPAAAQGVPPSQWPAEVRAYHAERVQECRQVNNGRVIFNDAGGPYVRTADFNGDGRSDFLVDLHGIRCTSAATLFCAALGCEYTLFASQPNGRFVNAGGFMGEAELIVQGGRPVLRVEAGQGVRLWGWNGRAFAIVGSGAPGRAAAALPSPSAAQPYGFTVNLLFTPLAAAQMARSGNQMRLRADYQGNPIPSRTRFADPDQGVILLGTDEVRVPGLANHYLLPGSGFDRSRVSWVRDIEVHAQAYTVVPPARAARATMDTLILCDAPIVRLSVARQNPVLIMCRTMRETR